MSEEPKDKSLVLYHGRASEAKALTRWQSSKVVKLHADRVRMLSPHDLTHEESLVVAAASLAHGLDYVMGNELHHWIQGTGRDRRLVLMRGKDGDEMLANEAAKREGTYLRDLGDYVLENNQKAKLNIPLDALAVMVEMDDYRAYTDWIANGNKLKDQGFEGDELNELRGPRPKFTGLGVMLKEEMDKIDSPRWWHFCKDKEKNVKNPNTGKMSRELRGFADCPDCGHPARANPPKYTHYERTKKRARTQALDQWAARVDPHALADGAPTDPDAYIIEGEWMDITEEELAARAAEGSQTLFGDQPDVGYTPPPNMSGSQTVTREQAAESDSKPRKETPTMERPYPPEIVRERFEEFAEKDEYKGVVKTSKIGEGDMTLVQYIAWQLNECFAGSPNANDKRHSVLAYLSRGKSESLTDEFWTGAKLKAIEKWLEPSDYDGHGAGLFPRIESRKEAIAIVAERMKEQGQMVMEGVK